MEELTKITFSFKSLFLPLTNIKAIHIIVIIGFIVYFTTFFNGFLGDDDGLVVQNVTVRSITNIPHFLFGGAFYSGDIHRLTGLYYRPMASIICTLIYSLVGLNPFALHFVQVVIHIVGAALVCLIFRTFFKMNIALFLALLFVVHPIQVESVAYISDLQDILFFFFSSLAFYLELLNNTSNVMSLR